jgi:hypothetical protein
MDGRAQAVRRIGKGSASPRCAPTHAQPPQPYARPHTPTLAPQTHAPARPTFASASMRRCASWREASPKWRFCASAASAFQSLPRSSASRTTGTASRMRPALEAACVCAGQGEARRVRTTQRSGQRGTLLVGSLGSLGRWVVGGAARPGHGVCIMAPHSRPASSSRASRSALPSASPGPPLRPAPSRQARAEGPSAQAAMGRKGESRGGRKGEGWGAGGPCAGQLSQDPRTHAHRHAACDPHPHSVSYTAHLVEHDLVEVAPHAQQPLLAPLVQGVLGAAARLHQQRGQRQPHLCDGR